MTTIETLIGNLLLRHNCVIVPSFGGFVAKQVSAKIDYTAGKMSPPKKSLLFNKQLINNDGLLVNEFALSNNLNFDIASNEVKEKVTEWNAKLKSGRRIELDRVGYLFLDAEKNLCFEQDRFFNLLLESFGLSQVHFLSEDDIKIVEHKISIAETLPEQVIEVVEKTEKEIQLIPIHDVSNPAIIEHPVLAKQRSNAWKYVAAACFLPIAFYSIWIPMKTDVLESGLISLQDFNPFQQKSEKQFTTPRAIETKEQTNTEQEDLASKITEISSVASVYSYKFDDDLFVPVKVNPTHSVNLQQQPVPNNEAVSPNSVHYIVGCFSDKENADNLVSKLNASGLMAKIVDFHNGLHRVSAGGALSIEGLNDIKMTANSLGLSGWILK